VRSPTLSSALTGTSPDLIAIRSRRVARPKGRTFQNGQCPFGEVWLCITPRDWPPSRAQAFFFPQVRG